MKSSISARFVAAAALAIAAIGATSAAHASGHVYLSVGVQAVPIYVEPAPVYVQAQPMYVQPRPIYVQPPAYAVHSEVYGRPCPPRYDSYFEEERAWRPAEWHRRAWRRHHDGDRYQPRGRDWE
jgi:hypothetical protein